MTKVNSEPKGYKASIHLRTGTLDGEENGQHFMSASGTNRRILLCLTTTLNPQADSMEPNAQLVDPLSSAEEQHLGRWERLSRKQHTEAIFSPVPSSRSTKSGISARFPYLTDINRNKSRNRSLEREAQCLVSCLPDSQNGTPHLQFRREMLRLLAAIEARIGEQMHTIKD